jgi:hypothetical protein
MNCRWCLCPTPFCEGIRNRPYCLRCDFSVCKLCFPSIKCLFPDHSPNIPSDPAYCSFGSWSSLCSLGKDRSENTSPHGCLLIFVTCSIVASLFAWRRTAGNTASGSSSIVVLPRRRVSCATAWQRASASSKYVALHIFYWCQFIPINRYDMMLWKRIRYRSEFRV